MVTGRAQSPLSALRELSAAEATGEMICAAPDLEAHVYLQEGRIAWATSSASRYAFGRDLVRRAGIDQKDFREVVETCRRERRPLGETLVEWGLTTTEDVRASLAAQVRDVVDTLQSIRKAQTIFLERGEGYRTYAAELTFALHDFVDEEPNDQLGQDLLLRAQKALPDAHWIDVIHGGRVVASHDQSGQHPRALAERVDRLAFGGDVRSVTVRSGLGTLVGYALDSGHRVLLGLGGDTRLGAISAALPSFCASDVGDSETLTTTRAPVAQGNECEPCSEALWQAVSRSEDIVSAQLRRPDGSSLTVSRCPDISERWQAIVDRGQQILDAPDLGEEKINPLDTQVEMLGFHFRSALLGAQQWQFGAMLPDSSGRSVWLTVPRRVSQGLGWALLTATSRHLAEVACTLRETA